MFICRRLLPVLGLAGLLAAGCAAAPAAPTVPPGPVEVTAINPPRAMSDFTLTSQDGSPISLDDLKGKTVLLAFGYTHCPDVCPITLARFKHIKEALGDQRDRVRFVWVSVDGQRDTPERLAQYLGMFDSAFIGLTGDEAAVRQMIEEYGGVFVLNNAGGLKKDNYTVDHTASHFLLDAQGRWVRTYAYSAPVAVITDDLLKALAGG